MTLSQYNRSNFFKAIFLKYLAFIIGVCYMANPLQDQIGTISHGISHFIETPNIIIGHADFKEDTHKYHEHTYFDDNHEHQLIDFLVSILDDSEKDDNEESLLVKIKFDKHIKNDRYTEKKVYSLNKKFNFFSTEYSIKKAYSGVLKEPPQAFLL